MADSKHTQRVTEARLRKKSRTVIRLNHRLKRKMKHLKHLRKIRKRLIQQGKQKAKRSKKQMKQMKQQFRRTLKLMKKKLARLRSTPDTSSVMSAHITAEESIITDEGRKLTKVEKYIKSLKQKLHVAHET